MNFSMERLTELAFDAGKAIVILIIGKIVIGLVDKAVKKALAKTKLDPMLHKFIANTVKVILWAEIIIAIMTTFGFNASSLLTVFAAAGAAIALALQGSLSNFASGILIMVTKPFGKGDYIVAGGNEGTVDSIDLLATTITTVDNRVIIIPNGQLTSSSLVNVTKKDTRMVAMEIGVAYDSDIEKVKQVITDYVSKDSRVLESPAPFVAVNNYGSSAVEMLIRVWCGTGDYWGVKFDLQSGMKEALVNAGITIPYPKLDVNLKNVQ